VGLRWQAVLTAQMVWNRSTRRAGARGGAIHELHRLHDDIGGAVLVRTLQLQHDLAGAVTLDPFVGDGRPRDLAAKLL